MLRLDVAIERFPTAGVFTIARGSRTEAVVVTATVSDGSHRGRGECVPYARYGETVEGVTELIAAEAGALAEDPSREGLRRRMKPGAARNALDAALWDYEAKRAGVRAWALAGLEPPPEGLVTCYTISLGTPEVMQAAAEAARARPLLKVKLGGEGDDLRIAAVRAGAPGARLVADANEAWRPDIWDANMAACVAAGVELIEQPLPAGQDEALASLPRPIPICADESFHGLHSLAEIGRRYDAVNIKLDKTGGLTEAIDVQRAAKGHGLRVMIGCMVGTSLAMAPALLLAAGADFVDLDGPLLLAADRDGGLRYDGSLIAPFGPELWG